MLAEGTKAAAEKIGPKAVDKVDLVKGMAPHAYEFRAFKGTALMQAVGHRGDPLPLRGSLLEVDWHHAPEWFQQVAKEQFGSEEAAIPSSYGGKAMSAVISEHMERVPDSLGVCKWLYNLFIYQDVNGRHPLLQSGHRQGLGRGPSPEDRGTDPQPGAHV